MNNFFKKPLDKSPNLWYIIYKMNEELNWNEFEEQTQRLLDAVCVGIKVPTDEEAEEAKDIQQGDSLIL